MHGREAELPAIKALIEHLRSLGMAVGEPEKSETPDYFLSVDGQRHAVEVTDLMEDVPLDGKRAPRVPSQQHRIQHEKLTKEIQETAIERGTLRGDYIVHYWRTIIGNRKLAAEVKEAALAFIEATKDEAEVPMTNLCQPTRRKRPFISITKLSLEGAEVTCTAPPLSAWEGECIEEAKRLLNITVAKKANALKVVPPPKVLVLVDDAIFIKQSLWQSCLPPASVLESFAAVFVVNQTGEGRFVYRQPSALGGVQA